MMNISIIGTGYVGLVTGVCFASKGNKVTCIDIAEDKILRLKNGEVPIYEPGLEDLLNKTLQDGNISFSTQLADGIKDAQILFLALPTPPNEDGSADLSHVLKVAQNLSTMLKRYTVIVNKSTVPVGTGDKVAAFIKQHGFSDFDVVSNPEFLREGMAVNEFLNPDRVVLGTYSDKAFDIMKALYLPFVSDANQIVRMDIRSSEMTKYAANSFLATRLSFINEIANLCELTGANIDHVKHGIGLDKRIGLHFLNAGIGYGGSCFPKDVKALINTSTEHNYDFQILKTVDKVNNHQRLMLYDKAIKTLGKDLSNKRFGVWGLAFKPDTDDVREAPAKYLIQKLIQAGATVQTYDPAAMGNFMLYGLHGVTYCQSAEEVLHQIDALFIVTEWDIFKKFDLQTLKSLMGNKPIFDGRNIFKPQDAQTFTLHYQSIGRP